MRIPGLPIRLRKVHPRRSRWCEPTRLVLRQQNMRLGVALPVSHAASTYCGMRRLFFFFFERNESPAHVTHIYSRRGSLRSKVIRLGVVYRARGVAMPDLELQSPKEPIKIRNRNLTPIDQKFHEASTSCRGNVATSARRSICQKGEGRGRADGGSRKHRSPTPRFTLRRLLRPPNNSCPSTSSEESAPMDVVSFQFDGGW